MTYIYAALGIAMISGISIMFNINNNINDRFDISKYKNYLIVPEN